MTTKKSLKKLAVSHTCKQEMEECVETPYFLKVSMIKIKEIV